MFLLILGVCNCYNGFLGDECDVSDTDPPELSFLLVALCDIQAEKCESVVVNGIDFVDGNTLTCHFINQDDVSNNYIIIINSHGQLKKSSLKPFGQINWNLVGRTYGRFCIKLILNS